MTFTRHGNPSKQYRDSLRSITVEDWKRLELACVEAVLNKSEDIIVTFPYTFRFPKGFPKGIREKAEGPVNYQRIKVNKLLKWLNEKGHSNITMEMLRIEQIRFTKLEKGEV